MKTDCKLKFCQTILFSMLLAGSTALAQTQSRTLHAAPGTPVIDGEMDDAWKIAPVAHTDYVVKDALQIPAERASKASFRCLWDADHLYVLAEVDDSNLNSGNTSSWEQDSVEFFVDENMARSRGYESNDGQFRVNYKGDVSYGASTQARIKAAAKKTPSGYIVEAAIPIRTIDVQDGTQVGFEVQVNNDAGQGSRASIAKWNDPANNSWHDTSTFGTLVLSSRQNVRPYDAKPAENGATAKIRPAAADRVPDWARDAVFYQIFPERFRNGDPSNDPTRESLEFPDVVPATWHTTPWTDEWYARADWEQQMGKRFYEDGVFHRRYGGDLQGVIDKLDYLADLGINTLYFNPVFYARSLHKYDGNTFHHIDPFFGPDPEGDLKLMAGETNDPHTWKWTGADKLFLKLVEKAHAKNMRVIIDGVFNHTGRDFWAFADIVKNQQKSPYLDWYTVESFDDPATPQNEFKYACWWGVETLPELANNENGTDLNPQPKAYIFDATRRWMDPTGDGDPGDGIDGWRLDVANEVPNQFWRDWHAEIRKLNPQAFTVAEIWNDAGAYLADCGFSSTMNYHGFAFPVKGFLIDGTLSASDFAKQLTERMEAYDPSTQFALQNLVDSHDTDRVASMIVNADHHRPYVNKDRFDYDVGERACPRSFRDYDVAPPNEKQRQRQRLVALFQATFVGPPMIYYGTESGMDGADDPDDRMPMVWDDLEYAPRTMGPYGKLDKSSPVVFDRKLHDCYRQLFEMRKNCAPLRRGDFKVVKVNDEDKTIAFTRSYEGKTVLVVLNRGDKPSTMNLALDGVKSLSKVGNLDNDGDANVEDGNVTLTLPAYCGCVWWVNE